MANFKVDAFALLAAPDNSNSEEEQPSSSQSDDDSSDNDALLAEHLALLNIAEGVQNSSSQFEEIRTTPLFSMSVKKAAAEMELCQKSSFPQYALLAGRMDRPPQAVGSLQTAKVLAESRHKDPRIFLNVNAPWSAFVCGSQGSGKSHSLSCMLENCLLPSRTLGALPKPLTALLFHYDSFTSAAGGQVCEAAYLCTSGLEVTVLVSPSNLSAMTSLYGNLLGLAKNVKSPSVKPLLLDQSYLNAERLMTLMAAGSSEGALPLYMQTVLQVLREMAREPKLTSGIDYSGFKNRILAKNLTPAQLGPLSLRLDLLESFVATGQNGWSKATKGNDWTPSAGKIVIVDLSCPFVDTETACGLFEMCLGVFLEQKMDIGRVVALDEAHKFMKETNTAANKLTDSLVAAIRLQRHLACRVIVATQEPTISPQLLDLCSITLVHRFTSPEWLKSLKGHLAAASMGLPSEDEISIFAQIVQLNAGEALLFAPSAMLDVELRAGRDRDSPLKPRKLGVGYLKVRIRHRLTSDGGRSICAV